MRGKICLAACVCLLAAACTSEPNPSPQPTSARVPNPAARKCVDDGYQLEPVRTADGVVVDHRCVDPASGKSCEAWDYFRGTCRLRAEGSGPPSPPYSDPR